MGASILRSYEEEHRLVQENATLRSQLEALRRQCENEADWRRDARGLQVPGGACASTCVRARTCTDAQVHTQQDSQCPFWRTQQHTKRPNGSYMHFHRPNSPNETRPWWQRSKCTWTAWETCASNSKTSLPT